jgi:hypothetical protein
MQRSATRSVAIRAPFDCAWDFIANPENLHLWTVDFALYAPTRAGEVYRVETPRGSLDLFVKTDRQAGTIDFHFGKEGRFRSSPSRLLPVDGGVLYVFTQFEPDDAPAGLFERLVVNVEKELQILKERLESA